MLPTWKGMHSKYLPSGERLFMARHADPKTACQLKSQVDGHLLLEACWQILSIFGNWLYFLRRGSLTNFFPPPNICTIFFSFNLDQYCQMKFYSTNHARNFERVGYNVEKSSLSEIICRWWWCKWTPQRVVKLARITARVLAQFTRPWHSYPHGALGWDSHVCVRVHSASFHCTVL